MILTRIPLSVVKSLLPCTKRPVSSIVNVLKIPVRNITRGVDHLRLGNVGGRMEDEGYGRLEEQTGFIGKFKEKSSKHEKEFDKALGMSKKQSKQLSKIKTWISYSIDADEVWTYKVGFKGSDAFSEFQFKSDEEFTVTNVVPVKYLIKVKDNVMTEKQTNVLEPEKVVNIVRKVEGDKLTALSACGGVVMTKVYKRVEDDEKTIIPLDLSDPYTI